MEIALSTLVSHSLHEDPYGRVQRDIPRVLEALVLYLGALEQLIDETNANPTPSTEDAVKGVVQPVADGASPVLIIFGWFGVAWAASRWFQPALHPS